MPWRPSDTCVNLAVFDALQFGHGGDAVETHAIHVGMSEVFELQFGHGGDAVETFQSFQFLHR